MSKRKLPEDDILKDLYLEQKLNCRQIADMYDVHHTTAWSKIKRLGIDIRQDKGINHHGWKGGRIFKGDGYYALWMPEHPKADKQGYVREHQLVAFNKYGRWANKDEVVHHIDGNKLNNDPSNIVICSIKQHQYIIKNLDDIFKELYHLGHIHFDKNQEEYVLKILNN